MSGSLRLSHSERSPGGIISRAATAARRRARRADVAAGGGRGRADASITSGVAPASLDLHVMHRLIALRWRWRRRRRRLDVERIFYMRREVERARRVLLRGDRARSREIYSGMRARAHAGEARYNLAPISAPSRACFVSSPSLTADACADLPRAPGSRDVAVATMVSSSALCERKKVARRWCSCWGSDAPTPGSGNRTCPK